MMRLWLACIGTGCLVWLFALELHEWRDGRRADWQDWLGIMSGKTWHVWPDRGQAVVLGLASGSLGWAIWTLWRWAL